MRTTLLFVLLVCLASCGDESGDPFLSGALEGSYDGATFVGVNGFATVSDGNPVIVVGDGPVHCGSESSGAPPKGRNAAIHPDALAVGTYSSVFVQMFSNVGSFEGVGASLGTLTITSVTDASVAGEITFDYTDGEGRHFTLDGTFEVVHCAY